MGFPSDRTTSSSSESTPTTSHTVNLPAGIEAGDRLLISFGVSSDPGMDPSFPGDWSLLRAQDTAGSTAGLHIYTKVASGSEGSTINVTTTGSVRSVHHGWRFANHTGDIEASSGVTGGPSTIPDAPNLAPSWGNANTRWIAIFVADGYVSITAYPNSYTKNKGYNRLTGVSIGRAGRDLEASSENPTAFTISAAAKWAAVTVALPGITEETGFQGVANFTPEGQNTGWGEMALQGVGTFTPQGAGSFIGQTQTLQGVGRFFGTAEGIPTLDFTVYDFYLESGGVAHGFLAHREQGQAPGTSSVPLRPARSDVGFNPFELRPETGDFFAQGDFSQGAGQLYFHRAGRNEKAYWWSEGFDISEPGKLTHLHEVAEAYDNTNVGVMAVSAGVPFVAVGTKVRKSDGLFPGNWSEEDPQASGTDNVLDLASAGDLLFAALDSTGGIHKRTGGGSWSHFSDVNARRLGWVLDRLIAATATDIQEINMGTGAGTSLETFESGWTCEDIFEAGGFIHAVLRSSNDDQTRVHHYGLVSGSLAKVGSTRFPQGQQLYSGAGYLSKAYLGGGVRNTAGGYDPILYEADVDSDKGLLSYTVIAEDIGSGSASYPVKAICPLAESILCGWSLTANSHGGVARDGIARYDLSREAFSHHLKKATANGKNINSVLIYKGVVMMSVDGDGVFYEDSSEYVATAQLITSVGDWGNAGLKTWEECQLAHGPLVADTSVKAEYTTILPEDTTNWYDVVISDTLSSQEKVGEIGATAGMLCLRITSYANGAQTAAPLLLSYSVRSVATISSDPEYRLLRYVRLLAEDRRDPQAPTVWRNPQELRGWLQSIVHQKCVVYEPGVQWNARVEQVSDVFPELPFYQLTSGEPGRDFYIMQLILRGSR